MSCRDLRDRSYVGGDNDVNVRGRTTVGRFWRQSGGEVEIFGGGGLAGPNIEYSHRPLLSSCLAVCEKAWAAFTLWNGPCSRLRPAVGFDLQSFQATNIPVPVVPKQSNGLSFHTCQICDCTLHFTPATNQAIGSSFFSLCFCVSQSMFKGYAKPPSTCLYVPVFVSLRRPRCPHRRYLTLCRPCLSVCMPCASRCLCCPAMEKPMHAYLP